MTGYRDQLQLLVGVIEELHEQGELTAEQRITALDQIDETEHLFDC